MANFTESQYVQHSILEITTIAKGAGMVLVGTIVGSGLGYVFQIFVARNLGTELFGLFSLGLAVFKISEKISDMGLPHGITRYVAIFQGLGDKQRVKGVVLLSTGSAFAAGGILGIIIYLFSNVLSVHFFHKPGLAPVLRLFAIILPFSTLTTIFIFLIKGLKIMKYEVFVKDLFEPLLKIIMIGIAFALGWRLYGVLFAYLVTTLLGTIMAFYYLTKLFPYIREKRVWPIYESKKLFNFSWPLLFVYFAFFLLLSIDILMLGYFKTSQDAGVYSAAQRMALVGAIVLTSFNSIFAPFISDLYNQGELSKLDSLFKIVNKWVFTFIFPVHLVMIFFAKPVLSIFGPEFVSGAPSLIILSIGFLVHSGTGSVGLMITMTGKSRLQLMNAVGVLTIDVFLNLLLIPKYGISGAAMATAAASSLINIINLLEVYILLKMQPYRSDFIKPLVIGSVTILILFVLTEHIFEIHGGALLWTGILIYFVIYITINLLVLGEDDKSILRRLIHQLLPYHI